MRVCTHMKETKINIAENGQYNNIKLTDIQPDEYIIVEKKYATGREIQTKYGLRFTCGVIYQGKECSFFLSEKQHNEFMNCGGEGDKVKIWKTEETIVNKKTKVKMVIPVTHFEKVE